MGAIINTLSPATMARAAEEAGADGVWVEDHLLVVDEPIDYFPYSDDGRLPWNPAAGRLEALIACAFIGAATKHCRVGTAVLVLPQRPVLELAVMATTLDRMTGGRLVLGVGAGCVWTR
jgi:alkanesulfonate monooxygenase SsuD/methylene tetrahydromethanopterin reductase-like flavin-dependent oxidoreductase (luciferase family)